MRDSVHSLLAIGVASAAVTALAAASLPPVLSSGGGLWDVSRSATGAGSERICIQNPAALAQWEHRRGQCTRVVISSTSEQAVIHYTCTGGGFGQSDVKVITPRTLRIDTQGISGGLPFSYVLHARRVGNC